MIEVYVGGFLAALTGALTATPVARNMALRFGFLDVPTGRKLHTNPVPYLGGMAMMLAFSLAVAAGGLLGGFGGAYPETVVVVGAALFLAVVGLVQDLRGLAVAPMLLAQAAAGLALYLAGIRVQLFDLWPLDLALSLVWVMGTVNALKLLDNMDGLSAGISAIASGYFFVLAALSGQYLVAGLAAGLLGCSLGFLWYNRPPARIFMGEAGSLFLGFLLAVLGIKLRFENLERVTFFVPIAVMGVPILDFFVVAASRLRRGGSILEAGRDHISHRLVAVGIPQKAAVGLLLFAGLAAGWSGAIIAYARPAIAYMIMGGLIVLALFFTWLLLKVRVDTEVTS